MRITIGLSDFDMNFYTVLVGELSRYSPCLVTREGAEVTVQAEGDVVKCMSIVAICDKYKFGRFSS